MIPKILGVLNVTPDSFSDGGEWMDRERALEHAVQMMAEGADFIDVGGESTRPGSLAVEVNEELRRVVPVVSDLVSKGIPVSIDTKKPLVAEMALELGASLLNDVSGFRDPKMLEVVQRFKPIVCVMHMQGDPQSMQQNPHYENVVQEVREWLTATAVRLTELGLTKEKIWIDPGIGFGKTLEHNLELLRHLKELVGVGFPVLIGVSRKRFLGTILEGAEAKDRLEGALATQVLAQQAGVHAIRTHDVAATVKAARVASAILNPS